MPDGLDPQVYRRVVGHFATGVTVITTYAGGVHHALTCNSFTSVSLNPVLVLFCVVRDARLHDAVLSTGTWGVSVLGTHQQELSRWFATRGRPADGQFDGVAHHQGSHTGSMLLDEAIATMECRTTAAHPAGDHTVVVGEVLSIDMPSPESEPLLYFQGRYRAFIEQSDA